MLLILMVIWDYKQLEYSWLVSIIVLASNTEALSGKWGRKKKAKNSKLICYLLVYMSIPYFQTLLIITFGILGRVCAQLLFLNLTYFNEKADDDTSYFGKSRWISI